MLVTLNASQLLEQAESDTVLDQAEITFRADYEGMYLITDRRNVKKKKQQIIYIIGISVTIPDTTLD